MSDIWLSLILEVVFLIFCVLTILIILRTYLEIKESVYLALMVFFTNIIALLIFNIQLRFFFYLKKLIKLYWLPLVASFYIGFGLIVDESLVFFISYAVVIGFVIPVILLREGRKTRNGLAFGLVPIVPEILRIIGIIISTLAVLEFFDKHLFQDKEEKERIQSAWISKLTSK